MCESIFASKNCTKFELLTAALKRLLTNIGKFESSKIFVHSVFLVHLVANLDDIEE